MAFRLSPKEQELVHEELSKLDSTFLAYSKVYGQLEERCSLVLGIPISSMLEELVIRALRLHRHLIALWGGWRSAPSLTQALSKGSASPIVTEMLHNLQTAFNDMPNNFYYSRNFRLDFVDEGGAPLTFLNSQQQRAGSAKLLTEKHLRFLPGASKTQKLVWPDCTTRGGNNYSTKVREGDRVQVVIERVLKRIISDCRKDPSLFDTESKADAIIATFEREYSKLFQALAETVWSSKRRQGVMQLSCAPSDFLRLGHYGENSSCYQDGHDYEHAKWYLAFDVPDSFVLALNESAKKDSSEEDSLFTKGSKVKARSFGVAVPGKGAFISNFYLLSAEQVLYVAATPLLRVLGIPMQHGVAEYHDSTIAHNGAKEAHSLGAFYVNGDNYCVYPSNTDKSAINELERALATSFAFPAYYGRFTLRANGPVFVAVTHRNRPSRLGIAGLSCGKYDAYMQLWSYKDFDLEGEAVAYAERHSLGSEYVKMKHKGAVLGSSPVREVNAGVE